MTGCEDCQGCLAREVIDAMGFPDEPGPETDALIVKFWASMVDALETTGLRLERA